MPLADGVELANFASEPARGFNDALHAELSSLMCWDAVIRCALEARAISIDRARALSLIPWAKDFSSFVAPNDTLVRSPKEMADVPAGAFIAFIEVDRRAGPESGDDVVRARRHIIHAMVSLGDGWAAGNKNSAIGIGHHIGWEALDLANALNWRRGRHRYDVVNAVPVQIRRSRPVRIRFRPLAAFQEPGARILPGRQLEIAGTRPLGTGEYTLVGTKQIWDVGPLSGCVALAAIRPATVPAGQPRPRRPRGPDVFLWHVDGGLVDRQSMGTAKLKAFLDGHDADWVFVHGPNSTIAGARSFRRQDEVEAMIDGFIGSGHVVRHYQGDRLVIDSTGEIRNSQELRPFVGIG